MGLIEAILIGLQFKRLEKPLVFVSMLFGFLFFVVFGIVIVAAGLEGFMAGKGLFPSVAISSYIPIITDTLGIDLRVSWP